MQLDDIYDKEGQDGIDNKAAFEKMPQILKYFISSTQKLIVARVIREVERRYGKNGVSDLVKTSGFRAHCVNARYGGVTDSLHLYGCACDFRKCGLFAVNPIPVCSELQIIDSGDCWHIQIKRS